MADPNLIILSMAGHLVDQITVILCSMFFFL